MRNVFPSKKAHRVQFIWEITKPQATGNLATSFRHLQHSTLSRFSTRTQLLQAIPSRPSAQDPKRAKPGHSEILRPHRGCHRCASSWCCAWRLPYVVGWFNQKSRRGSNQLSLVVYPIIYRVFAPSQVVVRDFWTINNSICHKIQCMKPKAWKEPLFSDHHPGMV